MGRGEMVTSQCSAWLCVVIPDVPSLHQLNFDGGSHIVSMSEKGLHKPASEFEKRRSTGNTKSHKKAMKENHRCMMCWSAWATVQMSKKQHPCGTPLELQFGHPNDDDNNNNDNDDVYRAVVSLFWSVDIFLEQKVGSENPFAYCLFSKFFFKGTNETLSSRGPANWHCTYNLPRTCMIFLVIIHDLLRFGLQVLHFWNGTFALVKTVGNVGILVFLMTCLAGFEANKNWTLHLVSFVMPHNLSWSR